MTAQPPSMIALLDQHQAQVMELAECNGFARVANDGLDLRDAINASADISQPQKRLADTLITYAVCQLTLTLHERAQESAT